MIGEAITGIGWIIEYGPWGVTAVLIGVIIWMVHRLLQVLESNNDVIKENTRAFTLLDEHIRELRDINGAIRDNLLQRPCQKDK